MMRTLARARAILSVPPSQKPSWAVLREPHFWILIGIITCGTIFYYADSFPIINSLESSLHIDLARRSFCRILSILPVAYAAFVFGLPGGLTATTVIAALLLPRVFVSSSDPEEAAIEVAAFAFIGAFVSWLIDVQNREKTQHRGTIASLEWTQRELRSHIEAVENEERRLSTINAVLSVLAESLGLRQMLEHAMEKVQEIMRVEKWLLYLLDEDSDELTLEAYHGVSSEFAEMAKRMRVGEGLNGRVAQTGEPLATKDLSISHFLSSEIGLRENVRVQLTIPIKSKGRVLGTFCVATSEPREYAPEEIEPAVAIGNAIGVAIENAQLYEKERAALDQLRQSEEGYRGLFENATGAIEVHDLNGKIVNANKAFEKLTGYGSEELKGLDVTKFLNPRDVKAVEALLKAQYRGDAVENLVEFPLTKRDGSEAIVELMPSLIIRAGHPVGVQSIVRDITEQRRMQENLRYYVSQVLKAQESERLRIARELHDDTAQALTGVSRRLDMLSSSGAEIPPEIAQRLDELREQTDTILDGVRRFSQDLRPPVLDDLGLLPALKWLLIALEEQDGIGANTRILGEPRRLPRDAELALFRIAQEALSNVRKHSHASAVELTLDFRNDSIAVTVADNGNGFELPPATGDLAASGKLGLIGMQERARLLGGTIDMESKPGEGTKVVVTVPG
ncbi:MAG TPA: PAS domain S-box protein [Dehalococcoidia bacterium]|nr:PAS domain S-box protein [Dehalococcoidia bacterium]